MAEVFKKLSKTFNEKYGNLPVSFYFSPGRVNLIGEHIDYNGGYVFPCAITLGTYGVARKREDKMIRCYSLNFPDFGPVEFHLNQIDFDATDEWVEYVKGMVQFTKDEGHPIDTGFDLMVYGDLPNGAGLSSSASLELLVGVLLEDLYNLRVDRIDLIKMGQRVENEVIGVNSGIMDQFVIGKGQKDMAVFLDTATLAYELVPAAFKDYVILIMNTNKRRELAGSKYNTRRQECERALEILQETIDIHALGELSVSQFKELKKRLTDEVLLKRVRHVVSENERVNETVKVLRKGNLERFGELLTDSHISLKEDYEITGIELDTLVEAALAQDGVLGARMTGAGMGGCAIALVHKNKVGTVIENVQQFYLKTIGYEADFYIAEVGDGAKVLKQMSNL